MIYEAHEMQTNRGLLNRVHCTVIFPPKLADCCLASGAFNATEHTVHRNTIQFAIELECCTKRKTCDSRMVCLCYAILHKYRSPERLPIASDFLVVYFRFFAGILSFCDFLDRHSTAGISLCYSINNNTRFMWTLKMQTLRFSMKLCQRRWARLMVSVGHIFPIPCRYVAKSNKGRLIFDRIRLQWIVLMECTFA